ncbi:HNH endonuclease family protein [Bradyrhizobium sp. TZ2]
MEALSGSLYLKTRVCKPVLYRLDERLSTGGASYDEQASIEHVLPQTVGELSEWAQLFPDETKRSAWTHRIANLVLLTRRINSKASNWDFEQKKVKYFATEDGTSPFILTQAVLQTKTWSLQYLEERQKQLISALASVWDLDLTVMDTGTSPRKL